MNPSSTLWKLVLVACIATTSATAQSQRNRNQQPPPKNDAYSCGGLEVVKGNQGELCFSLWTYARYLNQMGIDTSWVDAFGRDHKIKRRQDIQTQKVTLTFKGWMYDQHLRYQFYVWTSNPNQGLPAQTVVAGYLAWEFNKWFTLLFGTDALPTTRSTSGNFPLWLKVDTRTIADEYFRGSYTMGVSAFGKLLDGLDYRVMLGNNLSQLGVDATQLDNQLNTVSATLRWMPTTREFGPGSGNGDFESHQKVASLLALHFTQSREDAQSQADPNAIENSQIRLSDGTNLFDNDAFKTGGQVRRATYRMMSSDAGLKYRGFSLEGSLYWRWIVNLSTVGTVPVTSLSDHGYEAQASAMLMPKQLQLYATNSEIFGQYGKPWDLGVGLNFFPAKNRKFRVNGQMIYLNKHSPVGYTSLPYPLGGRGFIYTLDAEIAF